MYILLPLLNGRPAYGSTFTAALGTAYGATYPSRTAARLAATALRATPPALPVPALTRDYALGVVPGPRGATLTVAGVAGTRGSLTLLTFSNGTAGLTLGSVRVGATYRVYAGRYPYLTLVPLRAAALTV